MPHQPYLIKPDPNLARRAIDHFLSSKEATGRSIATLEFYQSVLSRFIRFGPEWPPTPADCERFFLSLQNDNLSAYTLASYYRGLNAWLRWCVKKRYISQNPLDDIDRPREPAPSPRVVPLATLRVLFATIEQYADQGERLAIRDNAMFRLCLDTGIRCSKLAALKITDLDLDRQSAIIRHAKGGKTREVYYGAKTTAALRAWLPHAKEWLFPNRCKQRLTRHGIYQALKRWCKRADLPRFAVHDLRHSYVTHAMRKGINPRDVSHQAGHSNVAFTIRVYGSLVDEERRRAHLDLAPGDDV